MLPLLGDLGCSIYSRIQVREMLRYRRSVTVSAKASTDSHYSVITTEGGPHHGWTWIDLRYKYGTATKRKMTRSNPLKSPGKRALTPASFLRIDFRTHLWASQIMDWILAEGCSDENLR